MQKRSASGTELKPSKTETKPSNQSAQSRAFFVDGQLDIDAYFEFLEEFREMFPDKAPRSKIEMKIVKL